MTIPGDPVAKEHPVFFAQAGAFAWSGASRDGFLGLTKLGLFCIINSDF
jgi:hypothetical protein